MKHEWKDGVRVPKGMKADVAANALAAIQKKHGTLTADAVLREARRKTSPLHPWFEWDDTEAARLYRMDQARLLIRSVTVRFVGEEQQGDRVVRAFVNLGEGPEYEDVQSVLTSVDRRALLVARALRELERVRAEYAAVEELAGVFAALDEVRAKVAA